ncbi:TonB-dependent receptor plug domain-containing protein [Desulfonatronum thiodismutans]|uniref:TonB-dependent receptor plug domain-containing protein n=1 Tax=Desulfonatronum thiodismutans TaxID=159290 RepID=UPI0004ABDA8C|nr:TonB-dependent receptor [Desulfonatronum thiodismutans]
MKRMIGILVGACALFFAATVTADEGESSKGVALEQVTVTARGIPAPVSGTPGGVGVVDAETIAVTAPVSLTDAAVRLPGVDKSSESAWGGDVNIRGLGRDAVVFLIDGARVNVTTDINGRFGLVNPKDIQRIEVLKGPISALYGSGSIGGVVNIITKKGRFLDAPAWNAETSLGGGSNPGGGDVHQIISYNAPRSWLWGSIGYRDFSDYKDGNGDKVRNSGFEDFSAKLAAGFKWNEYNVTEFQYQHLDGSEIGVPGTGMAPLPVNADVTLAGNNRRLVELSHSFTPEDSLLRESTLQLSYQLIERRVRIDNFTSGAVAWIRPEADHATWSGNWKNVMAFGDHVVVAVVDAWNWHMDSSRVRRTVAGTSISDKPTPETDQTSVGVFAEDDWALSTNWSLNLGARADYVRVANKETEDIAKKTANDASWGGHAGLTWRFAPDWSMTTLAASSYRTPNILERFKNINLVGGVVEVGDPDLDPERSLFFEYGIHHTGRTVRSSGAAFYNQLRDYIVPELIDPSLYRMGNVSKAELYGAELSLEWDFIPSWTVFGNIAYTQGKDKSADEWLRFVAPLNGLFGVTQKMDSGLWWTLEGQWAAKQTRVPRDTEHSDAWITMNARAGYDFTLAGLRHAVVLGVTNIFDETYGNYLATSRGVELREPGLNAYLNWRVMF